MPTRPMKFLRHCLTQWISKLLGSFEIHWVTVLNKCSFIWGKGWINIPNDCKAQKYLVHGTYKYFWEMWNHVIINGYLMVLTLQFLVRYHDIMLTQQVAVSTQISPSYLMIPLTWWPYMAGKLSPREDPACKLNSTFIPGKYLMLFTWFAPR